MIQLPKRIYNEAILIMQLKHNTLFRRLSIIVSTLIAVVAMPVHAQEFVDGKDYHTIATAQPVQTGDKIEVAELFWYGCQHCYALEPYIVDWKQNKIPDNAQFVAIPAVLTKAWEFHAQAFHAFQALDLTDKLHGPFFEALHGENRQRITDVDALASWVTEQGQDGNAVKEAFNSFAVLNRLKQSTDLSRNYQLRGVPSIVVGGKYRTSVSDAGSAERLFKVIEFLIDKAAAETSGQTKDAA